MVLGKVPHRLIGVQIRSIRRQTPGARVAEINTLVNDKPESINEDPYGEGWLALISPSNLEEDRKFLISAEKYFELMKSKIKDEMEKNKKEA